MQPGSLWFIAAPEDGRLRRLQPIGHDVIGKLVCCTVVDYDLPVQASRIVHLRACGLFCLSLLFAIAGSAKPIRLQNETIQPGARRAALTTENKIPSDVLVLVQFAGPLQSEWRSQLESLGVQLVQYVPEDAFVADLNGVSPEQLHVYDFVAWIGEYRSEHKIHRALTRVTSSTNAQARAAALESIPVSVLLSPAARTADAENARGFLSRIGQESRLRAGTVLRGEINPGQLQSLARSRAVLWVEPAPQIKLFDEVSSDIVAGEGLLGQTLMRSLGYDGAGVTVAVADSGLDSGDTNAMHPDIEGRVKAIFHYGTLGQLEDGSDEHSHGTHCAGIIAGNGATGEVDDNGFLFGLGVAPGASLIGQRIFDAVGGYAPPPSFETLTRDAKRAGADIGSNSWGDDTQGRYDLSAMEFDELVRDADALTPGDQAYILEFSAGNAGPGGQTIGSPAVAKNVIATGAAQNDRPDLLIYGDGPDAMADFSSRGPCEDGRIKPDLTAPGTWIASLRSVFADDNNAWGEISQNYMYQGGTSQAGPHVSGAAAVFVQYWRQTHTNATPSPALVKAALINSATDMDETAIGSAGFDEDGEPIDVGFPQDANPLPNMDEGWGRVDLPNLIGSTKNYQFVDQSALLTSGQQFEQRILIGSAAKPLKITLVYTDVPGTPLVVPALVNDLDLEVLAPDGKVFHGNQFNAGESILDAPGFDTINNVEAVHLSVPVAGEYIVRIRARNVPMDARKDTAGVDQDFALVVSGSFAPPGTGIVTFDRRVYTAPSTMNLRLVDYDLAGQPSATVALSSSAESGGENVILQASGTYGLFTGAVATATGPAIADGVLQVQHGNVITARYQDAVPPAQRLFNAQADLLPPVISGVFTTNRFGKAQVHWTTDEAARSLLIYGNTPALGSIQTNSLLLTNHTAVADGQISGQTNYFMLVCSDEAGNRRTNHNSGQLFTYVVPFAPAILMVDGYFGDLFFQPPVENYTDALDELGLDYDVWDVETLGPPTVADLRTYRVVLWRIAEFSTTAPTGLTLVEQAAIRDYLNSGGSLFIASMELISRLGLNSPFVREVLHVSDFVEDAAVTSLNGVPNHPISDGMTLELDYTEYNYLGFFELNASDTITPGTGAEGILTDADTDEYVGLRYPRVGVDSPGRIVFLSFPFDTVAMSSPEPNNRTTLLRRSLLFLAPGLNGKGSVAFNQSAYSVPGQATVEVADSDLEGLGQISITLTSDTQTSGVSLNLQETIRRGVFRGTFAIVPTLTGGDLTELRAAPGDNVYAAYFDASANLTNVASVPVENTPPVITSPITVEAGYVDAVVYWETDEMADSQVEFGESPLLVRTALDSTPTKWHAVSLPQLEPARTYYFRIVTKDSAGNITVDDKGGALHTFTTREPRQPPWTDDLEGVNTNWTVYTVDESERGWELGVPGILSPPANSPTNAWGSNLSGEYASAIESYLISPAIQLTGGNSAKLTFWHAYDFTAPSEFDILHAGEVLLLTDNALEPISLGVFSDEVVDWEPVEIDLSAYTGKIVYIAWHYFLFSLDNLPRVGWLVDDVSITVSNVPTGTLVISNNLWQSTFILSGPSGRTGSGRWITITNAAAGQYTIQFGGIPYYSTPPAQTNTLVAGGTIAFTGNYTITDSNTNGMPDGWEQSYFGNVSPTRTRTTDTDGDGLSDYAEYVAGTSPTNNISTLELAPALAPVTGNLSLQWPSAPGHAYRVLGSSDVISWTPVTDWIRASSTVTGTNLPTASSVPRFFRVEAQP